MESSRFFVANLPVNTNEKDLQYLFQDYGEVKNIELKTKESLVDPNDIRVIAFVTLNIGKEDAQYCLNDLNWQKIHGQNIKVSLAKESFLERLKREREEAKSGNNDATTFHESKQSLEQYSDLLNVPKENKRKTFDVNAELDDDEVAPELMITKKRAASSMHNGKIVIQAHDVEPIHVIENKHKKKKTLDTKSNSADQKRKESLNKMKNQYEQKKNAIQQALQEMGSNNVSSKKIKFSDAESDQEDNKPVAKTNIFGSDDENEHGDDDISFRSVPLGKKGEKLAKMRAEQSLDPRFRIDEKFVDDDDEELIEEEQNEENAVEDERQWQMNILEQVVGTKIGGVKSIDKSHKNLKMLRYDPSKDDHQKFERTLETENQKNKSKSNEAKDESKNDANPTEVSKDVFYVVTDTLQESLRTRGEGFSLLNMFGRSEQLEKRDEQLKMIGNEKILVNNKLEKSFTVNPFSYDSSSESEGEEVTNDQENITPKAETDTTTVKNSKKKSKIVSETFFIPKNDIRLKEGAKFFIFKKTDDDTPENYEEVRNRLKLLIKTKITKTKKNLANAGYKGKRKAKK
ncbi:hypothetical protein DOY81_003888 [Sarcophaga bullata]|nr:hypothetical protein DOY81_003888 [Sarcophaga bullata]